MKKKLIGLLILTPFLLLFNTATHAVDSNHKTTEEVLDSAWGKFGLVSYMIGETEPIISIGMDKTKSEEKLQEYLDQNLPPEAKEKYDIEIIKRDIDALEKEVFEDRKQKRN
ncbi:MULTISPECIES: hypothetical protein [Bacillus]|uniref:Uncharacterized protein n=1 Tax=Bacillus glycinifermentans TaxID=1664069 RepID=A0A0T6BIB0_9BACI|nr:MULTISPECIES: hypothetical protein [Bacillus]KRT87107.1 hypothetical protein AB447_209065 [Bacillus glycinifermentans]MEC0342007.1 hypothetical protein [Bacillus sonorensis]MEC0457479.1 hypothetical protein [Bacillus sonorensis]MEC0487156.1 hypothetical protein [Bacillus glycinifermentans]MEC0530726.1 hypothetical protein [Bacillus sonorensis]